jgi:glycine/D-amino acid oxidase-like deaminating enzyme
MSLKAIRAAALAILLSLAMFVAAQSAIANETRFITPPKLERANVAKRILCHRPKRQGSPKLAVERVGEKLIVDNYGHGGDGWTLAPGSAKYVAGLLDAEIGGESKETPIAVVGAGTIGLTSAMELVGRGYSDITVYADRFDDLTSHKAGGLWAPILLEEDHPLRNTVEEILVDSHAFYSAIAKGEHPTLRRGARILPLYLPARKETFEALNRRVHMPSKDVTLDFRNGTTRDGVVYDDAIFMDTGGLMADMRSYLEGVRQTPQGRPARVRFKQRTISKLDELDEKIVINCTGLGAAQLRDDQTMTPIQGHLIALRDQNPRDLEYMMAFWNVTKGVSQSGHEGGRVLYMFPKVFEDGYGVLGGTFYNGCDQQHPNEEEWELIFERAREFFGIKDGDSDG